MDEQERGKKEADRQAALIIDKHTSDPEGMKKIHEFHRFYLIDRLREEYHCGGSTPGGYELLPLDEYWSFMREQTGEDSLGATVIKFRDIKINISKDPPHPLLRRVEGEGR